MVSIIFSIIDLAREAALLLCNTQYHKLPGNFTLQRKEREELKARSKNHFQEERNSLR
jgi:hypothetical protein